MGDVIHCINGPELGRRINKAMGRRETERASLKTFSSDLRYNSEDIERVLQESGSSFEWLRHLQTALLGERMVLVASGWNRQGNYEGVWIWERDTRDPTRLRGLSKAQASDVLTSRIVPTQYSSSLRLAPMRDAKDVRVPLLADLVADEYWSQSFFSRREDDLASGDTPYHES